MFFKKDLCVVIVLYVDDLLITGSHATKVIELEQKVEQEFEMSRLGLLAYHIGIEFVDLIGGNSSLQSNYIHMLLDKFSMTNCARITTPMEEGICLSKDMGVNNVDAKMYQIMVGSLIFLTNTKPHVSYHVSCISRYMATSQYPHLDVARRILKYAKGTTSQGIFFLKTSLDILSGYVNVDWGKDLDKRKSTTCMLFKIGVTSLHWSRKL